MMNNFQFTLIMKTLLAIFHLRLNDLDTTAWEKANKEYDDLRSLFVFWQKAQKEESFDE